MKESVDKTPSKFSVPGPTSTQGRERGNTYTSLASGSSAASSTAFSYTQALKPAPKDSYDVQLSRMTVKDIKAALDKFGVSTTGCVEVQDFKDLLRDIWIKRERHFDDLKKKKDDDEAELKRKRVERAEKDRLEKIENEKAEKEKALVADRITKEVEIWAKNKALYIMLNEINGETETRGGLRRYDGPDKVNKAYKKALLKIHPDKHMNEHAKFVRATEMFKYVNEGYQQHKKKAGI